MKKEFFELNNELDVIVPVSLELDWPKKDEIIECILEQNQKYGYNRFILAAPCGGWRSVGYPPVSHYEDRARLFKEVRDHLKQYGISCGWWNTLTIKSGPSDEFSRMVKSDGTDTPFSSCPADKRFRENFAKRMAAFIKIAKPEFVFLEDDYSITASTGKLGCFCKHHLKEFEKRTHIKYTREELLDIFSQKTPESFELLKSWRELMRDSMAELSGTIREYVDIESPEVPIGYFQSATVDYDGDSTEAVCKALAGKNHIPYSRLFGCYYCGGDTAELPVVMYRPLFSKQKIKGKFGFYHETDTFPHIRFFTSVSQMKAMMGVAYSYGYIGSVFQTQQLLDDPNEELVYAKMYSDNKKKFCELNKTALKCNVTGVQICFDPFWNTVDQEEQPDPFWIRTVSHFGIPFTTNDSNVTFLDKRQAEYFDDDAIKKYLSKNVFMDGECAKILCERGYSKYIGINVGNEVIENSINYDLGAREIFCKPFDSINKGKNMPSTHMFANGRNGKLLKIDVIDDKCQVISELYTFQKKYVAPTMTVFKNELGGNVVAMGMTVEKNISQSLLNYRRRNLFLYLLKNMSDDYVLVEDAPSIYTIMNEAKSADDELLGMITLINLCDDTPDKVTIHLPEKWQNANHFFTLNKDGVWNEFKKEGIDLIPDEEFRYCEPVVIKVCK